MGVLTRSELVSQALNRAGDSSLTTLANQWLNDYLRSRYVAWPWPFTERTKSGLSLTTGTQSVNVGNGASSISNRIQRIHDPIYVYNSTYSVRAKARLKMARQGAEELDPDINDPSTNRGLPTTFQVQATSGTEGRWTLIPWPVPNQDYLLKFLYQEIPAHLSADADVPVYPNDETVIQGVMVKALQYMAGERSAFLERLTQEEGALRLMEQADIISYGTHDAHQMSVDLDPSVFK